MIVSASRRTDIPAFFSEWFFTRLKEGFAYVRNPFNPGMVRTVSLKEEDVDCFIFWTKNPSGFLERLEELTGYHYYFQFTLTPYGKDVEPNLPEKEKLLAVFKALSEKIGKEKVIWRYDPILISAKYTKEWHLQKLEEYARELAGHTEKCVISFVDLYRNTRIQEKALGLKTMSSEDCLEIAALFSKIAQKRGLKMEACSESLDFRAFSISKARCVDPGLIERITGKRIKADKDRNQRKECMCAESVDIGVYNTCLHRCLYCYANYNERIINKNIENHNPDSPFLIGS